MSAVPRAPNRHYYRGSQHELLHQQLILPPPSSTQKEVTRETISSSLPPSSNRCHRAVSSSDVALSSYLQHDLYSSEGTYSAAGAAFAASSAASLAFLSRRPLSLAATSKTKKERKRCVSNSTTCSNIRDPSTTLESRTVDALLPEGLVCASLGVLEGSRDGGEGDLGGGLLDGHRCGDVGDGLEALESSTGSLALLDVLGTRLLRIQSNLAHVALQTGHILSKGFLRFIHAAVVHGDADSLGDLGGKTSTLELLEGEATAGPDARIVASSLAADGCSKKREKKEISRGELRYDGRSKGGLSREIQQRTRPQLIEGSRGNSGGLGSPGAPPALLPLGLVKPGLDTLIPRALAEVLVRQNVVVLDCKRIRRGKA
jgi:hypothetical protein